MNICKIRVVGYLALYNGKGRYMIKMPIETSKYYPITNFKTKARS